MTKVEIGETTWTYLDGTTESISAEKDRLKQDTLDNCLRICIYDRPALDANARIVRAYRIPFANIKKAVTVYYTENRSMEE